MAANDVAQRVLERVRGNPQAIQQVSDALLSRDEAVIRQTLSDVAGVQLTDEQVSTVMQDYSTPEQVAAGT
jgi:hypothetical protein